MPVYIPVLVFWFILGAVVTAMMSFDRIIRWLHATRNEEWVALGRPTGYLFRPAGVKFWRSDSMKTALAERWFFRPPSWVTEHDELRRTLWVYRGAGSCAVLGMIALGYTLLR